MSAEADLGQDSIHIQEDFSLPLSSDGSLPQSHIKQNQPEEMPKQTRLLHLKANVLDRLSHPPIVYKRDIFEEGLGEITPLRGAWDVILIQQPKGVSWSDLVARVPVGHLSTEPGLVFLFVTSLKTMDVEDAHAALAAWGYRRAEDIVILRPECDDHSGGVLRRSIQHVLMGIKGTVRRSTDAWLVHCNIDVDVITTSSREHHVIPEELYQLIENFAQGTRRLQVFQPHVRRGWVSISNEPQVPDGTFVLPYNFELFCKLFPFDGYHTIPYHEEIESIRPKSPVRQSG